MTGLLPEVITHLTELNISTKLQDKRNRIKPGAPDVKGITLRGYQLDAIKECLKHERGTIEVGTGGGKTEIAAGIISAYNAKTAFITHTKSLRFQSAERLSERLGYEVGIIDSSTFNPKRVTVCMMPTLASRLKNKDRHVLDFFSSVELVITDEVHHQTSAQTWGAVSKALVNAYHRYGLSATPYSTRGEMLTLFSHIGPVVYKRSSATLREDGVNVPVVVQMYRTAGTAPVAFQSAPFPEQYRKGIVENQSRNIQVAKLAVSHAEKGEKVVILVVQQDHGALLEQECNRLRPKSSRFVYGLTDQDERASVEKLFKRGAAIMIVSRIMGEGKDIPCISTLINAAGGKSDRETTQKAGRGVRLSPGKTFLTIIDFVDHLSYLHRHSKQRMRTYASLGYQLVGAID